MKLFQGLFLILLLEASVEMSKTVSPVCLPRPNEFTTVEKEKSILIGFGTSRLWYQLYDELLGGELPRAPLIPIELLENETALFDKLEQPKYQENIIHGYFKTFKEIFSGIEACIDDNYNVVSDLCLNKTKVDEIVNNIGDKLSNAGRDLDEQDVKYFLGYYQH